LSFLKESLKMLKNLVTISNLTKRNAPSKFVRNASVWNKVEKGPEDPILGITVAYLKDTSMKKVNLGVGAYRDDIGRPYVLECVREAEKRIYDGKVDHEYLPIGGLQQFTKVSQELCLGRDSVVIKEKRAVTVQAISGTGALRLAGDFIHRFIDLPGDNKKTIYLPNPTWGNHIPIFKDAGLQTKTYKYYDEKTFGLDFDGLKGDMKGAPNNSMFLFHACAHNPTGVDPNQSQWKEISKIAKEKGHYVFVDLAYQGFASGDPEKDAFSVRTLINDGHNIGIAQSFAKNFGLYGERIGALTFITQDLKEAESVESQLKIMIRPMYSNPPIYGARVIGTILNDAKLTSQWRTEVKAMADRIITMREKLVSHLKGFGSKKDWSHITNQIGMFCYTGLKPEQVDKLTNEHHIYLTRNGRISVAGLSSRNVEYVAKAIHEVTK